MRSLKRKFVIPMTAAAILAGGVLPAAAAEPTQPAAEEQEAIQYIEKTVKIKGKEVTLTGTPEQLDENSPLYQEQLEAAAAALEGEKLEFIDEKRQDQKGDYQTNVIPDQYSTYRISGLHYNTFYAGAFWTNVKNQITVAAGLLAGGISTTLATNDTTKAAIAVGGTAVANWVTTTYAPDYTKSYYIKSYSSYHKMYVYRLVTNIYSDSSRQFLQSTKLSGLLKKSGSYFYAL